jgi:hypothetical protein
MAKTFQDRCRNIATKIIKKSFPELKNKKILIFATPFRKAYSGMALWGIWPFPDLILINRKKNNEPDKYLRGLLAHELSHIALRVKRGFIKSAVRGLFYWIIPKLRRAEEDEVNKIAMQKGYVKEIYFITQKSEKRKRASGIQRHYMSSQEVKNYAKSIGKW